MLYGLYYIGVDMTVGELRKELEKIVNQELQVVILSDDIDFKSVEEVFEDSIGFDNNGVKKCIRLK